MTKVWDLGRFGVSTALVTPQGETLTYAQLETQGAALAEAVGGRCLAFILCRNTPGSVLGYTACLNHGIVPLLLSSQLERGLLEDLMALYRPAFLWLPEEQASEHPALRPEYAAHGYVLLRTGYPEGFPLYEDLALLLTTSGSTGSPKLVRQSYANIRANTDSIVDYLHLDSEEKPITTLPMNYTYGLSIINTHLAVGATVLLTEHTLMQRDFWRFFREAEATSFGGVPYTYEILDKLRFMRMDLPSLRTMTQAGGKLLPELHEKFALYAREKGKRFVVMYGQCEATARMGYLPPERAVEKKGSMGIAIPGGRFRLTDGEGRTITAPFTTGELVYEGKNVTLGYAEKGEDLIKGDERHGVLETGDMAQFDEDGYYYIVGRKKRFLKIYGNRVNLDETERLIKGAFRLEAACAGVDDRMYVFLTEAGAAEDVKRFLAETTKLNPAAFRVLVIDAIPKNDSGKTAYPELSKYYTE